MEAAPGFEPGVKVLQTHALPLGHAAMHRSGYITDIAEKCKQVWSDTPSC